MFKKRKGQIRIGDKFIKIDDPSTVWVVAGHGSAVAPMPHFRVVAEDAVNRVRTLAESVLLDPGFYRPIKDE